VISTTADRQNEAIILLHDSLKNILMKMESIFIQNKKIAYYATGDRENEAIILLHGWPETSKTWKSVIPVLATDYYVTAIDLPGLGESDSVEQYDTSSIAVWIDKAREALHINKFHLISHDIGSWIASTYALLYENTLNSLTLIDAGIPGIIPEAYFSLPNYVKAWHFYFHAIDLLPEFLIKGKELEYFSWFFENKAFVKSAISKEDIEYYTNIYKEKMTNGFNYYRSYQKSSTINKNLLHKLRIPVLVIGGANAAGNIMKDVARVLSDNGLFEVIAECGHYVPEEQPKKLLSILNEFLKVK
jgi:pimeloyl-ACP methyl ester carboxylesterase